MKGIILYYENIYFFNYYVLCYGLKKDKKQTDLILYCIEVFYFHTKDRKLSILFLLWGKVINAIN